MSGKQPRVAFVGPSTAVDRAMVAEAGAELVASTGGAEVVHVAAATTDALVDAVELEVSAGRSVVLHDTVGLLDHALAVTLAARAEAAGVVVAVPFVHRYYPMVRLARRRVRSGNPGPLHLLHGWTMEDRVAAWVDLVEFVSGHRVLRLVASGVSATRLDSVDEPGDDAESPGAVAVLFETDHQSAGTLAVSSSRPIDGGTLLFRLDGVDESVVFHEGRAEVLDVIGRRSTERFQRGVGADVSRYSTLPAGQPQGARGCWTAFLTDVYAASRGASPDGLPRLDDLARAASLVAAVRRSESDGNWVRVPTDLELLLTIEGEDSMTLEAQVLGDTAVRAAGDGYEIDLHLAWYRSLPFSCLEDIELTVADVPVEREQLRVRVGGEELALDDLPERDDQWWFVQDPLTVVVPAADARAQGEQVDVDVVVATRIPYIIIGPDTALVQRTHVAKKVVVQ